MITAFLLSLALAQAPSHAQTSDDSLCGPFEVSLVNQGSAIEIRNPNERESLIPGASKESIGKQLQSGIDVDMIGYHMSDVIKAIDNDGTRFARVISGIQYQADGSTVPYEEIQKCGPPANEILAEAFKASKK
jgi:hypothetical protein